MGNQGNQLDLTGNIVDAIRGIVDLIPEGGGGGGVEPLIVPGLFRAIPGATDRLEFAPEPDGVFFDALEAFNSGRPVILHGRYDWEDEGGATGTDIDCMVVSNFNQDATENALGGRTSLTYDGSRPVDVVWAEAGL